MTPYVLSNVHNVINNDDFNDQIRPITKIEVKYSEFLDEIICLIRSNLSKKFLYYNIFNKIPILIIIFVVIS